MSDALVAAVRKGWREAAAVAPGTRAWRAVRIASTGPLAVLAGIRETDGATALLFEAPIENAPAGRARFEADGISMLEERSFPDRVYRIVVTLERRDLDTIFGIVTADLIEAAAPLLTPPPAVAALFSRLEAWQAFLRARRQGLGREAVIGLLGELLTLRRLAAQAGWYAAVEAWLGPSGGLHDFLRHGHALEVKTGAGIASVVEISSLDQLEDNGLSALLLVHVHLAETAGGTSLPLLVSEITDAITHEAPGALRILRDALLASGYVDIDAELYLSRMYQPLSLRFYRVEAGFPRLTRTAIPQGVTEASYRLDLRSIQPHLIDDGAANGIMRQMGD